MPGLRANQPSLSLHWDLMQLISSLSPIVPPLCTCSRLDRKRVGPTDTRLPLISAPESLIEGALSLKSSQKPVQGTVSLKLTEYTQQAIDRQHCGLNSTSTLLLSRRLGEPPRLQSESGGARIFDRNAGCCGLRCVEMRRVQGRGFKMDRRGDGAW